MRIEVSYVNKNKKKKQKCEESSGHSGQLRPELSPQKKGARFRAPLLTGT
jgi:hypothetical protein